MLAKTINTYDDILAQMECWDKSYQQVYDLYQTLERDDIRLSQSFLGVLMAKLHALLELTQRIADSVGTLDSSLQATFDKRLTTIKQNALALHNSTTRHPKIKHHWVRLRIWYSGHYAGTSFIPGNILHAAARDMVADTGNYGHVSLETAKGYLSLWPQDRPSGFRQGIRRYMNSLYEDLCDEGPDSDGENNGQRRLREPEVVIDLFSLEVEKINDYCLDYVRDITHYALLPKKKTSDNKPCDNCTTVCLKALQAGGIDALFASGDLLQVVLQSPAPNSFARYLESAQTQEHQLFGRALSTLTVPTVANVTQDNPARFKASNLPLVVTQAFIPRFGNNVSLAIGDKLLLDDIRDNNWLVCKKGDLHLLVPRDCVKVDNNTLQASASTMSYKPK